jgi:hypothetical protein
LRSANGDDQTLRANVLVMLDDERSDTAVRAARFACETLDDEQCRERIVELASSSTKIKQREKMRELAETLELGDGIDRLQSYQLDFRQSESCEERRRAVARLRALGDPRSIALLKKAKGRKRNACLADDAGDAIRYLESVAERQAPEPADDAPDAQPAPEKSPEKSP